MEWQDQGILLSIKRLGESKVLATFFTEHHGKQAGILPTDFSPHYFTPLAHVMKLHWRGRTAEQLGQIKLEPLMTFKAKTPFYSSYLLKNALLSLVQYFLLSNDPHPELYDQTLQFLNTETSSSEEFIRSYFEWEFCFLKEMGFAAMSNDINELSLAVEKMADHLGRRVPIARLDLVKNLNAQEKMSA